MCNKSIKYDIKIGKLLICSRLKKIRRDQAYATKIDYYLLDVPNCCFIVLVRTLVICSCLGVASVAGGARGRQEPSGPLTIPICR